MPGPRAAAKQWVSNHIPFQDLRHFSATQMLGAGVDPRTAAGRLGHDTSMLLRIYGHVIPAKDKEAAAILG
jgi:integrase